MMPKKGIQISISKKYQKMTLLEITNIFFGWLNNWRKFNS